MANIVLQSSVKEVREKSISYLFCQRGLGAKTISYQFYVV